MSVSRSVAILLIVWAVAFSLPKISLPVSETGPMTISLVQGYSFDPLEKSPVLPAALSASGFAGDYSYCLVQFPGPIRHEWRQAVERQGAELLWYVPQYAFVARVPTASIPTIAAMPEVRWLGADQPAYKLCPGLDKAEGRQTLIVVFHYQENEQDLLAGLRALGAGNFLTEFNAWNKSVRLDVDASQIPAMAQLPGVYWIEPYSAMTPDNKDVQWVDQRGYSASDTTRVVWHKGVSGTGMLVGITDTPMNIAHDQFRDPANNTPGPNHRKVVAYRGSQSSDMHGTHTTGTLCGSDDPVGSSQNDGLAKNARVFFQNYSSLPTNWDMNTWFRGPDSGLNIAYDSARALNHSMSLSRKDTFNIYIFTDMTTDQFVWSHRKFMHCNSMGNYGTNQMGHPVMAKNIISTGGTEPGTSCRTFYTTSSRGPTQDGRRKPQLISPANNVVSADYSNPSGYVALSGTSMATPNMTASTALIRNYFQKGYYPTGDTLTGTPMGISAALNKATAIVGADNDMSGYTAPDNNIGWGRIDLDSSLYFAGDTSKLWVTDETLGLATGDSMTYSVNVTSAAKPFRVTLCWSDYPGTMRAALILVNNLDLTTISPTGIEYKGSVYTAGQSVTGGIYDTLNVEECTRLNSPEVGIWTIKVKAKNIPQGPQPFALAAIGVFGEVSLHDVGTRGIIAPADSVDSGETVSPEASVYNFGTFPETFLVRFTIADGYWDTTSVTLAAGTADTVMFEDWTADSLGVFAMTCSTELVGDANPGNDRAAGTVEVFPFIGIVEQGNMPRVFALDKASPSPFTGFTTIRYAVPRQTPATLSVYSATGALVRTLQDGTLKPGYYATVWNGRDAGGGLVPSGIYLYRLEATGYSATGKVLLGR
jgi:hypothetical protein